MASKEMNIPTIDFCKLEPGTAQWESTKTQVLQALQEYGCFEAIYNNVSKEIREAIFDKLKEIFEFPLGTKQKNFSATHPLDGYKGQYPTMPWYESLCIAEVLKPESTESFASIFWPDGNPDFCDVVKSYSKSVVELDEMVKRMVLESLGLKNHIGEFLDSNVFNCRFSRYKAAKGEDLDAPGLVGHTDSGFMVIISQNEVNGLQVRKKNGVWINVNIAPNSFFVQLGDSFMAWTNGRVHSPFHKVTMAKDGDRFSIPFFSVPKPDYIIEAPKELVDEEHPLLFKPYGILDLSAYRLSEAGRKAGDDVFKAFCGV